DPRGFVAGLGARPAATASALTHRLEASTPTASDKARQAELTVQRQARWSEHPRLRGRRAWSVQPKFFSEHTGPHDPMRALGVRMADGLNRVMLLGNLGADPELRMTGGGQAVLKLRLATSESYLDKNRVRQERTE